MEIYSHLLQLDMSIFLFLYVDIKSSWEATGTLSKGVHKIC